jgi:hypothetical protein
MLGTGMNLFDTFWLAIFLFGGAAIGGLVAGDIGSLVGAILGGVLLFCGLVPARARSAGEHRSVGTLHVLVYTHAPSIEGHTRITRLRMPKEPDQDPIIAFTSRRLGVQYLEQTGRSKDCDMTSQERDTVQRSQIALVESDQHLEAFANNPSGFAKRVSLLTYADACSRSAGA